MQVMCFPLPDTSFIAVTCYHNEELKKLKVDNPFATAFCQRNTPPTSTFDASGMDGDHVASESNTIAAPPFQPLFTVGDPVNNDSSMMTHHQHLTKHIHALAAPQRKTHNIIVECYLSSFPHTFNVIALFH